MISAGYNERQDKIFAAHISDLFTDVQQKYASRFTSFLDMHHLSIAQQLAQSSGYPNYLFYGGHCHGERMMLGVFPEYEQPDFHTFPIIPICAAFRREDIIGHRDILGSLMGIGIKRDTIGDILVGEGCAVFFVLQTVAPVIMTELTKIGRHGIKLSLEIPAQLPTLHDYQDFNVTVRSLRLDCIVAAVTGLSREKAVDAIQSKQVMVNGILLYEIAQQLKKGDIISIRGYGKYLFAEVGALTKKGRQHILCKKYI